MMLFSPAEPGSTHLARAALGVARLRDAMLALAAVLAGVAGLFGVALPWLLVGQALAMLFGLNRLTVAALRRGHPPRLPLAAGLAGDIVALTEILAFTGGAANPLASLYLPVVLIAALLVPGRFVWALALAAVSAYGLLFRFHLPWPLAGGDAAYAFSLHLVGMWLTFALSALLIAGFVARLSRRLVEQEAALARAREAQLADEQLVALGVQAAGAAHALSTPLNTLTLLAGELKSETADRPQLAADWAAMDAALLRCREALAELKEGGEVTPSAESLRHAFTRRLEGWRALKPGVRLVAALPPEDARTASLSPLFWPAFFNLLNNAAEADPCEVRLNVEQREHALLIDIVNPRGTLSDAQLSRAGLAPVESDKPAGLGIGMMLSHATLSRLGGTVRLENRAGGGVLARLELPLLAEGETR
ncbi:ATP-binding protein [Crenobacter cavernae]|uniref:histidine kinase n=1 Tax=Crenobacter cavernae TaxID=2290923 RepID=A0ABY0FEP5_9NEIS|nr:ATP-binding protein [Crenobacter cavernae]RXZ44770.1 sensor histidine kinase [Crenobacter cavernae]